MKKFYLFLMAMMVSVVSAFAQGNLLTNGDFAVVGPLASGATDRYAVGEPWVSNVAFANMGIRVMASADATSGGNVLVWRGSGNSNYISQPVSVEANKVYKVTVKQVASGNANANFNIGIGTAAGQLDVVSTTVRLGTNNDGEKTVFLTMPASISGDAYFTFSNTSNNTASSGQDPVSQIDYFTMEALSDAEMLTKAKEQALSSLPTVTEGSIFSATSADIDAAKAAIEAATSVEEVNAAVAAISVPALSGEWTIFNATAENYLGYEDAQPKLVAEAASATFHRANGGFYIKVGEKFINMKGGNTWSMSADAQAKTVWNFELNDDKYTIKGPNGLIGSDATAAGQSLYGNKAVGNNGLWIIESAQSPAAGWDGTVITSMDNGVVTKLEDLNNLKLIFNGAKSIEILGDDDLQYLALQNEDGSSMYGLWSPALGSSYTIDGQTITLDGFNTMDGVTVDIPSGTTKLYIEDYGTLAIDGKDVYLETIELTANISAPVAEPFALTSVSNNGVNGDATKAVEASENGVMYQFEVTATGKELSKGEGVPTLTLLEDGTVDFGPADLVAYEAETAYIRFMTLQEPYFTQPGTYVLTIPEGTFVDENNAPNAATTMRWVVIQGEEKGTFAITGATNAGNEPGEVEALSYMFEITAANAITALHEGNITLTDAENQPVGGNAMVLGYEGEEGAATVYARFTFDTEDHQLHTAGVYTLNVPAGMFADAEGNLNEAFTATWTIKEQGETSTFAITGATNAGNEAGEVEVLSYMFEITAANAITALHEGNITLTDAENQPVGGYATVVGYEGEEGSTTVYARFTFDTEDHQLHTPGVYTLNVPVGMFADAEGNLSEAYTATWTVVAPEKTVINITNVAVDNNDPYTVTMKFNVPAEVAEVAETVLNMTLNGEAVRAMKMTSATIEEGVATIVFTDDKTPEVEGAPEYRLQPGTYVAFTDIQFKDAEGKVIENLEAKYIGSIVLEEFADDDTVIVITDANGVIARIKVTSDVKIEWKKGSDL